jgi:hypothetical protein
MLVLVVVVVVVVMVEGGWVDVNDGAVEGALAGWLAVVMVRIW